MEFYKQRKVFIITGKPKYGKTFLGKKIIRKYPRVIIIDPNEEYNGYVVHSFSEFVDYMKSGPERFCVVCRFEEDFAEEYLFRAVWEIGNCLLVLEEFGSYSFSEGSPLFRLARRGRHRAISLLCISVRIPDIDPVLRSVTTSNIAFFQDEPIDLIRLENHGFNADKIRQLPKYQYEIIGESLEI